MVYRFFKSYFPSVIITILVIGILLFLQPIIQYHKLVLPDTSSAMPLMALAINLLGTSKLLWAFIALALLIMQAYYLVRLNLHYYFIEERTYLPALLYLLFSSAVYMVVGFHPLIIATLFLIIVLDKLMHVPNNKEQLSGYFDMGLLLAVGSLFYANMLIYGLFVLIGLILFSALNFRKFIIIVTGMFTIYFTTWFVYFFSDNQQQLLDIINANLFRKNIRTEIHFSMYIFLGYLGFIMLMASGNLLTKFNQRKIIARKYFSVVILLFLFALFVYFLVPGNAIISAYIVTIPLAFLFADYFVHLRLRWFREVAFILLILLTVFVLIIHPY